MIRLHVQRLPLPVMSGAVLGMLLATGWFVFKPALSGDFLFDDFVNLPALGQYGPVADIPSLIRYLTSGIADPTGRPVSMLSFLIDSRNWPADPYAFKRTNLLVHLINGCLLAITLQRLGSALGLHGRHAAAGAFAGAALWLLHPLWVSTVAYVIQRQAMLPMTFVLCGILTWNTAVTAFARGDCCRGWTLSILSVAGFGTLAGLSKANGFLLPAMLLVLHFTVWSRTACDRIPRPHALANLWLLIVPSTLIVTLLLLFALAGPQQTEGRGWTVGERLLTQPRVLFDYIHLLLVPRIHSAGLFADAFPVSTDLFRPRTTLPSIIGIVAIGVGAVMLRRTQPALSAAVLFFLSGHLLESTTIPLELYFEHRNYLPAALLGWPIGLLLTARGRARPLRAALLSTILLASSLTTTARADLWGTPGRLAEAWARTLPDSPRAQAHAAHHEMASGRPEEAIARLKTALAQRPGDAQLALNLLDAECMTGSIRLETIRTVEEAVQREGIRTNMVHEWFRRHFEGRAEPCPALNDDAVLRLVSALRRSARSTPSEAARLAQIDGLLALHKGACNDAVEAFNNGQQHQYRPDQVHGQAGLIASRCGPSAALDHIRISARNSGKTAEPFGMRRLHARVLAEQQYWQFELTRLTEILNEEALMERAEDAHLEPSI